MGMPASRTALIVGAGIGGLAAGLALRRAGWQVRIHERAANPRELGFALALAPNAMAALRELGLADTMLAEGVKTTKAEVRRTDGQVMRRSMRSSADRGCRAAAALHGALLDAVGSDALVLGSEAVDVPSSRRRLARTEGRPNRGGGRPGRRRRRRFRHPEASPPERTAAEPSGFCALRGVAYGVGDHWAISRPSATRRRDRSGDRRASQNAVYWYLSLLARDVPAGARNPAAILDAHTAAFDHRFRAITAATRPEDMRFDELFERDALRDGARAAVTLLGDAAHPMLPHTGQGAAQALEDAVALGLALAPHGDVEPALRRYERVRSRRTRRLVSLGPRIARITTTRNPVGEAAPHAAIRWLPEAVLVRSPSGRGRDPHGPLRHTQAAS